MWHWLYFQILVILVCWSCYFKLGLTITINFPNIVYSAANRVFRCLKSHKRVPQVPQNPKWVPQTSAPLPQLPQKPHMSALNAPADECPKWVPPIRNKVVSKSLPLWSLQSEKLFNWIPSKPWFNGIYSTLPLPNLSFAFRRFYIKADYFVYNAPWYCDCLYSSR